MAHPTSTVPRLARALITLSVLLLGVAILLVVAAQASPGLRREVASVIGKAAGSTFEETPEHGYIATGESLELSDDELPSLANLDPALLDATRQAAAAADAEQGTHLVVTSGWRSPAYQQWLLDQAVARYGSAEEAAKWVSSPEISRHVTGQAIDIGPFDGTLWMQSNSSRFGLCQIYSNELWHYELASAHGGSCPPLRESAAG